MKKNIKIALDARTVYTQVRRGTGKNLIDLYSRAARKRPQWQFVMLHRDKAANDPFSDLPNVTNVFGEFPGDRYNAWLNIKLPLMARKAGADILHCPANVAPKLKLLPYVLTLHDLIPLSGGDKKYVSWWRSNVAAGVKKACGVITPSDYSKRQIVSEFGDYADKIMVNHWAPDGDMKFVDDPVVLQAVRQKYGIDGRKRYVFGFGAADTRKNTQRMLNVWASLSDKYHEKYQLVLVGLNDCAMKKFTSQVKEIGCGDSVTLCGFADEEDMSALLSGADIMFYPSLLEGFGLPILDAFVCRSPVVTSNTTSLPEVGGDAVCYVDPICEKSIADGLMKLMDDDSMRCELVKRGLQRVESFTWDACVDRFIDFIERSCCKK